MPFSSLRIEGTYYQAWFSFLAVKLLFPHLSVPSVWKDVIIFSLDLRSLELGSTSLRGEYLHKLFVILTYGRCVCSPPFIYILSHLCQHGVMGIYLYFAYNLTLFYFSALIVLISVIRGSLSWLLCPFNILVSWIFGFVFSFWALPYFLAL